MLPDGAGSAGSPGDFRGLLFLRNRYFGELRSSHLSVAGVVGKVTAATEVYVQPVGAGFDRCEYKIDFPGPVVVCRDRLCPAP
jgi:hypothetical protein